MVTGKCCHISFLHEYRRSNLRSLCFNSKLLTHWAIPIGPQNLLYHCLSMCAHLLTFTSNILLLHTSILQFYFAPLYLNACNSLLNLFHDSITDQYLKNVTIRILLLCSFWIVEDVFETNILPLSFFSGLTDLFLTAFKKAFQINLIPPLLCVPFSFKNGIFSEFRVFSYEYKFLICCYPLQCFILF